MIPALTLLPGTLPGLLRKSSPVVVTTRGVGEDAAGGSVVIDRSRFRSRHGVVYEAPSRPSKVRVVVDHHGAMLETRCVALDLSDPTGRAHAGWWARDTAEALHGDGAIRLNAEARRIIRDACAGLDVDAEALRRVCLHLAGVPDAP